MGRNGTSRWRPSPREARAAQDRLAARVARTGRLPRVELVAGVDCSELGERVRAAIVVLTFPALEVVATATAERALEFPYVPGLLAFREVPAIEDAWRVLSVRPDLLLVDGHGIAHPRRIGVASHVGVVLDVPSIGCGKSLLVGTHGSLAEPRGSRAPLVHDGERVGVALRTRTGVRPIYVSVGHRIDSRRAVELVLACAPRYRVPEPIRRADALAGAWSDATRTPARRSRSTGSAGRS